MTEPKTAIQPISSRRPGLDGAGAAPMLRHVLALAAAAAALAVPQPTWPVAFEAWYVSDYKRTSGELPGSGWWEQGKPKDKPVSTGGHFGDTPRSSSKRWCLNKFIFVSRHKPATPTELPSTWRSKLGGTLWNSVPLCPLFK